MAEAGGRVSLVSKKGTARKLGHDGRRASSVPQGFFVIVRGSLSGNEGRLEGDLCHV